MSDGPTILALRERVRRLRVADEVEAYLVALNAATRVHPYLSLGGSPRASVALYRAAQAWAFLDGRDFVRVDDVQAVAPAVLAHRLLVDVERGIRGATAESALAEILAEVPAPPGSRPVSESAAEPQTGTGAAIATRPVSPYARPADGGTRPTPSRSR